MERSAIVTGAAGAIGRATLQKLVASGFNILLVDRDEEALKEVVAATAKAAVHSFVADVTNPHEVKGAVDKALTCFGMVDTLINIAGGGGPKRTLGIEDIDLELWNHVIALNVTSTFLFSQAVAPGMRERGFGRIVNFSSILAFGEKGPPTTVPGRLAYATAKAALIGFTSQFAKDVGKDGITVNCIVPGLILGQPGTRVRGRFDALPDHEQARMLEGYPSGRAGTSDDVAAAVDFLVSEAAGYISGVALPVDGAYL
ncbi:SDR family NAD(P)-dependent oxidoreductase [Bradyrhizobium sp. WSM3983]|uniref:SDR family NAD(P)-dependent oxidoreductase n=1 Tax=Bradyrhizobium sp. WSM3983 TaxID=1038867 RepID=UPI0003F851E2|nr:SDR family NAD(P)-dependent oxidoreductase [Bradyrhizobium sp. WSM3983]